MEKYTILNKVLSTKFEYSFLNHVLLYSNRDFIEQKLFTLFKCMIIINIKSTADIARFIEVIFHVELKSALIILKNLIENKYIYISDPPNRDYEMRVLSNNYVDVYTKYIDTSIESRIAKTLLNPKTILYPDELYKFILSNEEIDYIAKGEQIE